MVIFPKHFVQLDKYPGYYWNTKELHLYSLKSGVLKKLALKKSYRNWKTVFNIGEHFQISHKGKPVNLRVNDLLDLKWSKKKEQHFPVQKELF